MICFNQNDQSLFFGLGLNVNLLCCYAAGNFFYECSVHFLCSFRCIYSLNFERTNATFYHRFF